MRKRQRRASIITVAAGALVVGCVSLIMSSPANGATTWKTSRADDSVAAVAAHRLAASSLPGKHGRFSPTSVVNTSWPSNVTGVQVFGTYRRNAEKFIDGSNSADNRRVMVLRLLGHFQVASTGPKGSSAFVSGTTMTCVIDAKSGATLDFTLGTHPLVFSSSIKPAVLLK